MMLASAFCMDAELDHVFDYILFFEIGIFEVRNQPFSYEHNLSAGFYHSFPARVTGLVIRVIT
jgi:hypothetical protein